MLKTVGHGDRARNVRKEAAHRFNTQVRLFTKSFENRALSRKTSK